MGWSSSMIGPARRVDGSPGLTRKGLCSISSIWRHFSALRLEAILAACSARVRTVLELGSAMRGAGLVGGGERRPLAAETREGRVDDEDWVRGGDRFTWGEKQRGPASSSVSELRSPVRWVVIAPGEANSIGISSVFSSAFDTRNGLSSWIVALAISTFCCPILCPPIPTPIPLETFDEIRPICWANINPGRRREISERDVG